MPTWIFIAISVLLALVPVALWGKFLMHKRPQEKRSLIWIFLGGTLTVIPILGYQAIGEIYPSFDFLGKIETQIQNPFMSTLVLFLFVGITEEIVKFFVVQITDKRHPELIQTVSSALTFSFVAALGFAFAENIFYFFSIAKNLGVRDLFFSFVFRSSFTAAGHMIFSGIFGYHYGIAKFSADITAHERYLGKKFYFTRIIQKLLGGKTYEVYQQQKILQGLGLALGTHALFNFLLHYNHTFLVIILIGACGSYMYYLLHRKTGHLLFSYVTRRGSTLAQKDEEVVMELLGMWTKEKKYKEVMEICDRLLKCDPDNNVVKLFRAKAADNQKMRSLYDSLKAVFQKNDVVYEQSAELPPLSTESEKIALELLEGWYEGGHMIQAAEVAKRLLARNPNSEGAKLILKKSLTKEKFNNIFDALRLLFENT